MTPREYDPTYLDVLAFDNPMYQWAECWMNKSNRVLRGRLSTNETWKARLLL